ncbi:MAG: DUF1622 domain-containing protein [Flavobacteriaceae bacterium]|nr:DUF1622 domain-containing protein [Flavobacteriaceae bacterium]
MDKNSLLDFLEITALLIELVGVLILILGTLIALIRHISKMKISANTYKLLRIQLRKNILIGLDFLVVGSLIKTVMLDNSLAQALTLSLIIIIRSFLSFSLQVEMDGKFPRQKENKL